MPKYLVEVEESVLSTYEIEANDLEDAKRIALNHDEDTCLPIEVHEDKSIHYITEIEPDDED